MLQPPTRQPLPVGSSRIRSRTRGALVDAALRVFARKGVGGAAIHEIAAEAGVSNGTFYNYFRTREEILEAASGVLAERFTEEISASYATVEEPAARVAIGCRRFILRALRDPTWGAAVVRIWASTPLVGEAVSRGVRADLRAGARTGCFTYGSERAAVDLVQGSVLAGMRAVLEGHADEAHAAAVATLVLRGLGVPKRVAEACAARPLPPLAVVPGGTDVSR